MHVASTQQYRSNSSLATNHLAKHAYPSHSQCASHRGPEHGPCVHLPYTLWSRRIRCLLLFFSSPECSASAKDFETVDGETYSGATVPEFQNLATEQMMVCGVCGQRFERLDAYKRHMKTH